MKPSPWRYVAGVGILGVVYFFSARLGLSLAAISGNLTLIWAPTGITLAALLLFGFRYWPGIMLGAFFANLSVGAPLGFGVLSAVGSTLEAIAGAFLLRRVSFHKALERVRDIVSFVLLGAAASTLVSATLGVAAMCLTNMISCSSFAATWWVWWLGDAIGVLVVAPVLLTWGSSSGFNWQSKRVAEAGLMMMLLGVLSAFAFGQIILQKSVFYPAAYLIILVIVWFALRFGQRETTAACLLVSGLAVWGTANGVGPFVRGSANENLLFLGAYVGLISTLAMFLAAARQERNQAEKAQQQLIDRLRKLEQPDPGLTVELAEEKRKPEIVRLTAPLLLFSLLTIVITFIFELAKEIVAPQLSAWQSRAYTIAFNAIIVPLAVYFVLRRQQTLYQQIIEEVSERKRMEDVQRRLTERTAQLEQTTEELKAQIAEREQAAAALKESEARYRAVIEQSAEAIFLLEIGDKRVLEANPAFQRLLGYDAADITNLTVYEVVMHDRESIDRNIERLITQRRYSFGEQLYRRKDGSPLTVESGGNIVSYGNREIMCVIARDITERKRFEKELQGERDFASQIMNSLGQGVTVTGSGGHYDYVNPAYAQMLGYQPEEVIGKTPKDFTLADDHGILEQAYAERKAGKMTAYTTRLQHRNGRLVHVLIAGSPRWQEGKVSGAIAVVTDLTEIRQAEESLRESEARFRTLAENVPGVIYMCRYDVRYTMLYLNDAIETLTGYPKEEFLSDRLSFWDLYHPNDAYMMALTSNDAIYTPDRKPFHFEYRLRHRSGEWRWVEEWGDGVFNANHEFMFLEGFIIDITERKLAEAERERLLAAEREQRLLAETLGEVTLALTSLTDHDRVLDEILSQARRLAPFVAGNIALVEGGMLRVARWQGYEAMGNEIFISELVQPLDGFVLDRDVVQSRQPMVIPDTLKEPQWVHIEETAWIRSTLKIPICLFDQVLGLLRLDSERPQNFSAEAVNNLRPLANAAAIAMANARLFEATKTSEAKYQSLSAELEKRVLERTAQLEAANRELEAFSYSVSHDLRAPLRGLDGFSHALLEEYSDKLDNQGKLYLQRVVTGAQRMSRLIDDMLNLARVARREMKVETVDLSVMARVVAEELLRSDQKRQVQFVIAEGLTARGDAGLLQIVIENLFHNAWKFTARHEQACIEFGAMRQVDDKRVYFVRDDGAGFDMAYADKLFGAFQRLHASAEFEGTGIGLATIQRIIHRHGGRVWAEGAVEKGATFYFGL